MFLIIKLNSGKRSNNSRVSSFLVIVIKTWLATWFYSLLLLLSGDVRLNPGLKRNSSNAFYICHWNLNSISAHNYSRCFRLKLILRIISFLLSVYQKHTLILVLLLMITTWKFLGTPSFVQTTLLKIGDKTCNFLSLYRSQSRNQDGFETLKFRKLAAKKPVLSCGNQRF